MITVFFVMVDRQDDTIAGTVGDVEWLVNEDETEGLPTCLITTDSPTALIHRLDTDDNVCSYEELREGDQHK